MHQFRNEHLLPISQERAWSFFSSPKNLSVITPPEMKFVILSHLADENIYEGMKIDYTLRPLFGISVRWQTEICKVQNHVLFTDKQTVGPYKFWEHTHTFSEQGSGVLMTDVVNYELPFGFVGKIAESILVRRKIKSIFDFRKSVLNKLFI